MLFRCEAPENDLWTMKLHLSFHQYEYLIAEFSFFWGVNKFNNMLKKVLIVKIFFLISFKRKAQSHSSFSDVGLI